MDKNNRAPRPTKPELYDRYRQVVDFLIYQPSPYWDTITWIQEQWGLGEAAAKNYYTEAKKIIKEVQNESYADTLAEAQSFWKKMAKDAFLEDDKETAMAARREFSKLAGHYIERQHVDLTANIKFEFDDE